jgi:hypothetical protein
MPLAGPNPWLDCSKPGLSKSTNPYPISPDPEFLDLEMSPLTHALLARVFIPLAQLTVLAPSTPLIASVFCAGVNAMPSRNGAPTTKESPIKLRTFRHHRQLLEGAPNQAVASPPLPLLHHADLGYQVCGNETGAGLSHGTTMWRTTAIMETGTKLDLFPAKIPFYQEDRDTGLNQMYVGGFFTGIAHRFSPLGGLHSSYVSRTGFKFLGRLKSLLYDSLHDI